MRALSAWVISDGRRGIENQALGLAEAAAQLRPLTISKHIIKSGKTFKALPPSLQILMRRQPREYNLPAPYPDIVIGCGRQAIAPLRALKAAAGANIYAVYIQDPRKDCSHFDLVIAPQHDGLSGPNVISMLGSPNRVTASILETAQDRFAQRLSALPMPRAALLIGGPSKTRTLSQDAHAAHLAAATDLLAKGYSLMISTSRRTPDWAAHSFRQLAQGDTRIWLYDGGEDNPYFAFLSAAQIILVTEESTNMLTEACVTGTPVFRLAMDGKPGKFNGLYQALKTRCGVTIYSSDASAAAPYAPLSETQTAAQALWARFDAALVHK